MLMSSGASYACNLGVARQETLVAEIGRSMLRRYRSWPLEQRADVLTVRLKLIPQELVVDFVVELHLWRFDHVA
jgi:hypothetical protein